MIRLTLNPQIEPEIHLFNKSSIIIGPESTHADLVLQDVEGASDYLKLIEENGSWQLINQANDPFISINDEPFGKKRVQTGDLIAVHQKIILFEILPSPNVNLPISEKESSQHSSMSDQYPKKEESAFLPEGNYPSIEHITLPFEHEVEALKEKDWEHSSIEEYILKFEPKKKENLESAPSTQTATPAFETDQKSEPQAPPPQTEPKKRGSLKDDYLRDLDDDQEGINNTSLPSSNEPSHLYQAWKWILLFIFSILSISGAVGTVIYYSVSDKTEAHETKATLATADIAMALTHAQLSNAKPHNHNWSDVEFLKSNLQSLLPNTPSFASKLDAQGQFNCCPYSLRIYTNGDLSHFILIAQPAPSVLYWLIPKPIIVLDSHLMELHALKDVRSLNRLLAMSDPLEGPNGKEITSLVKQGNIISLKFLAKESGLPEFSPPENLSLIHEGAENLIYNAPRYYQLTQSIIQKAINLSDSKSSSQEVASLKQEMEAFTWLKPIVLYSIQGRSSALQTKQGLEMLSPSDKILFGYLQLNPQGEIEQAHILNRMDEDMEGAPLTIAINDAPVQQIEHKTAPSLSQEENKIEEVIIQPELDPSVDPNHPIYVQLHALVKGREQELKPHAQTLSTLISQDLHSPTPRFPIEFQEAFNHYLTVDAQHTLAIKEALTHLSHQYEEMPADQFLNYMSALNLDHIMQQQSSSSEIVMKDENCRQNIETLLTYIQSSKTLSELNNYMEMSGAWLNFDYLKDPQELIRYQNILRNALLDQLQFILLEYHPSRSFKVSSEERNQLEFILNHERFIKPEEKEFFIEEFEHVKM